MSWEVLLPPWRPSSLCVQCQPLPMSAGAGAGSGALPKTMVVVLGAVEECERSVSRGKRFAAAAEGKSTPALQGGNCDAGFFGSLCFMQFITEEGRAVAEHAAGSPSAPNVLDVVQNKKGPQALLLLT